MKTVVQLVAICGVGAVLGLALNASSGRPVALMRPVYPASDLGIGLCGNSPEAGHQQHGHRRMSQTEATEACNSCTVGFVDARGAAAFAQGHIPGAVHLKPAGHPAEAEAFEKLRPFATVVVYDSGGNCGLAEGVADRLLAQGFKDVRLLDGSWNTWQDSGNPAQSGACEACANHMHDDADEGEASR